jgi:glutamine amidotransferase-like uncharacterized protein
VRKIARNTAVLSGPALSFEAQWMMNADDTRRVHVEVLRRHACLQLGRNIVAKRSGVDRSAITNKARFGFPRDAAILL